MKPELVALIIAAIMLCGCGPHESSACEGLVYSETGLHRNEYSPCATAMVAELDQIHRELQIIGDQGRSKDERRSARQQCFAANTRLSKLIKQAGGKQKLMASWEDMTLNRLNLSIISAQTEYFVECYYGNIDSNVTAESSAHREARNALAELR